MEKKNKTLEEGGTQLNFTQKRGILLARPGFRVPVSNQAAYKKKKKKKNDWSDLINILLPSASSTVP